MRSITKFPTSSPFGAFGVFEESKNFFFSLFKKIED